MSGKYVVGARLPVRSAVAVNRGSVWIQGAVTRARVAVAIHNDFSVFDERFDIISKRKEHCQAHPGGPRP